MRTWLSYFLFATAVIISALLFKLQIVPFAILNTSGTSSLNVSLYVNKSILLPNETFLVYGRITYPNGTPVSNQTIKIYIDNQSLDWCKFSSPPCVEGNGSFVPTLNGTWMYRIPIIIKGYPWNTTLSNTTLLQLNNSSASHFIYGYDFSKVIPYSNLTIYYDNLTALPGTNVSIYVNGVLIGFINNLSVNYTTFVVNNSILATNFPVNVTYVTSGKINITETKLHFAVDPTDYQINITIDTASLIAQGKLRSDCGDLRFTYYDPNTGEETEIPYWIESGCNTTSTKIWIKVPYIPYNGSSLIYLYYGNLNVNFSQDLLANNGTATFVIYHDFSSRDNITKDLEISTYNTGYWYISNGYLYMIANTTPSYVRLKSKNLYPENIYNFFEISKIYISQSTYDERQRIIIKPTLLDYGLFHLLSGYMIYWNGNTNVQWSPNHWYYVNLSLIKNTMTWTVYDPALHIIIYSNKVVYPTILYHIYFMYIVGDISINGNGNMVIDYIEIYKTITPSPRISISPSENVFLTNTTGYFNYTIKAPYFAGRHLLKINLTDSRGNYGENTTNINVRIYLTNPKSYSLETKTYCVNPNDTINISVYIPKWNINYPYTNLSYVWAKIIGPNYTKTVYLNGSPAGGTWFTNISNITTLGNYTIYFYANLTDGFNLTTNATTSFYVKTIRLIVKPLKYLINPKWNVTLIGNATLLPDNSPVNNTTVFFWINNTLLGNCTTGINGTFICNLTPPQTSGVYTLKSNITNIFGIKGMYFSSFEVDADKPIVAINNINIQNEPNYLNITINVLVSDKHFYSGYIKIVNSSNNVLEERDINTPSIYVFTFKIPYTPFKIVLGACDLVENCNYTSTILFNIKPQSYTPNNSQTASTITSSTSSSSTIKSKETPTLWVESNNSMNIVKEEANFFRINVSDDYLKEVYVYVKSTISSGRFKVNKTMVNCSVPKIIKCYTFKTSFRESDLKNLAVKFKIHTSKYEIYLCNKSSVEKPALIYLGNNTVLVYDPKLYPICVGEKIEMNTAQRINKTVLVVEKKKATIQKLKKYENFTLPDIENIITTYKPERVYTYSEINIPLVLVPILILFFFVLLAIL